MVATRCAYAAERRALVMRSRAPCSTSSRRPASWSIGSSGSIHGARPTTETHARVAGRVEGGATAHRVTDEGDRCLGKPAGQLVQRPPGVGDGRLVCAVPTAHAGIAAGPPRGPRPRRPRASCVANGTHPQYRRAAAPMSVRRCVRGHRAAPAPPPRVGTGGSVTSSVGAGSHQRGHVVFAGGSVTGDQVGVDVVVDAGAALQVGRVPFTVPGEQFGVAQRLRQVLRALVRAWPGRAGCRPRAPCSAVAADGSGSGVRSRLPRLAGEQRRRRPDPEHRVLGRPLSAPSIGSSRRSGRACESLQEMVVLAS